MTEKDFVSNAQLSVGYDSGSGIRVATNRLIGKPPNALKGRKLLKAVWLETTIGKMLAVSVVRVLYLLVFFDRKSLPTELKKCKCSPAQ
ncbi:hypothetical protein [Bartonella tamiae]|uniref:Uncharacterized protein n=1 Tax=Bartonella tamiae Th239 TaxID=1094558 RepID=J0ZR42_9HYPH|nr:hypothetical protein [Bartonella tamiae]EJF91153.1 hypothetical protein ME5_00485 [Bartonella tamiae Th239]EJF93182.1 hypothetical protein MEG_01396 [Bartonella tamiae Th307]